MNALIGRKLGMTRVFGPDGSQVPVTVLQAGPCVVVQVKTAEADGYRAAQLGFDDQKESRLSKAELGHLRKHGAPAKRMLHEVALAAGEEAKPGDVVTVELFKDATHVDVSGVTKGRGFQGVVRRHGMGGQPQSHGHTVHRNPGSVGMREHPGRLLRGRRLPGQMGAVAVTTQSLQVVQVRPEDHVLLVRGSVPGPTGGTVVVRKAIKKAAKAT